MGIFSIGMEIFFLLGCLVRLMEGNPPLFASEIGGFVSEKSLHGGGETVCREGVEGRYELENCTAYRWCKSHAYGCSRIPTKGTNSLPFLSPLLYLFQLVKLPTLFSSFTFQTLFKESQ